MKVSFSKAIHKYLSQPEMVWVERESIGFSCLVEDQPRDTNLIICARGQGLDAGDYPVQVEDLEAGLSTPGRGLFPARAPPHEFTLANPRTVGASRSRPEVPLRPRDGALLSAHSREPRGVAHEPRHAHGGSAHDPRGILEAP